MLQTSLEPRLSEIEGHGFLAAAANAGYSTTRESSMRVGSAEPIEVLAPGTGEIFELNLFVAALEGCETGFARAFVDADLRNWILFHEMAFAFFGGVPDCVMVQSARSGIARSCLSNGMSKMTYQELEGHFGTRLEKTVKENTNADLAWRAMVRSYTDRARSLASNWGYETVEQFNLDLNDAVVSGYSHLSNADTDRQPILGPLPQKAFEYAEWKQCGVALDFHIEFDKNYYSAPWRLLRQQLLVRATPRTIELFHGHVRVAVHARVSKKRAHVTLPCHMPSHFGQEAEWSVDRMRHEASLVGPATENVVSTMMRAESYPEQAFRRCMGVISLCKRFGAARVEAAAKRALDMGSVSLGSMRKILECGSDLAFMGTALPSCYPDGARNPTDY